MESYSNLCRLCLVTERNGVDLFKGGNSNKYSKELTEFFRIEVRMGIDSNSAYILGIELLSGHPRVAPDSLFELH